VLKRKIKNGRQAPKRLQEVRACEKGRLIQVLFKLPIIVGLYPQEALTQLGKSAE